MAKKELPLPEPPERAIEIIDFPAETDPPLRDRPRVRVSRRLSDRADVTIEDERAPLSASGTRRLISDATGSAVVKRMLGRTFVAVGGHHVEVKDGRGSLVMFYSYTNQWTVEARRGARQSEWSTRVLRTQPPLTDEETAIAIDVARGAIDADTTELDVGTMSIMREAADDPLAGRRLADVRFFPADQRLPLYFAIVDLADRKAVDSGDVGGRHHG
jgi:hypothetical protein